MPAITDGAPQCGFYRMRQVKNGPWLPVSISREDDIGITIEVGREPAQQHNSIWLACARHPVEYDDYAHAYEHGHWPGEHSAPREPTIGDNAPPPDPIEIQLAKELDAAKDWMSKTEITSDLLSDDAANRVGALRKLKARAEEAHKTEKAPHLTKCREIDERYLPLVKIGGRADQAIKYILGKIDEWTNTKRAQEHERQRLLREKEERAVALARASGAMQGGAAPAPQTSVMSPESLTPPKVAYGGITGNKISQRTISVALIVNQDECYKFFRDNPEVKAVLQRLSDAMVKAKQTVPGVEVREQTVTR